MYRQMFYETQPKGNFVFHQVGGTHISDEAKNVMLYVRFILIVMIQKLYKSVKISQSYSQL